MSKLPNSEDFSASPPTGSKLEEAVAKGGPTDLKLGVGTSKKPEAGAAKSRQPLPEKVDLQYLLLEDTTCESAPLSFRQLFSGFVESLTPAEILFRLVYLVALESGFASEKDVLRNSDALVRLPLSSSFHSKNVLILTRQRPIYHVDNHKLHFYLQLRNLVDVTAEGPRGLNALLTGFVTGDFMIITLTPVNLPEGSGGSICLSIPRYVLGTVPKGKPLHHRCHKLRELVFLLREQLYTPVRNQQFEAAGVEIYPSLVGLPYELYDEVFRHLNQNQLNVLANTNRLLHEHATNSRHSAKYKEHKEKREKKQLQQPEVGGEEQLTSGAEALE